MLDIIFLSFDEVNADANFAALKARFSHARRVHGIEGIANAHVVASKKALTQFFYVVDADAVIDAGFDFSFKPQIGDEDFVHIWHAFNPAINQSYGYGGVKLFNKKFFKNVQSQLDFSTTLTKDIKLHEEISCISNFNSDAVRAYRGAYREAQKLSITAANTTISEALRSEAEVRLQAWLNPQPDAKFRHDIIDGARDGVRDMLKASPTTLNDFTKLTPNVNAALTNLEQPISASHPMIREFFFTTRISSSLYDQLVLDTLPVTELRDAISNGQIMSKIWLTEELQKILPSYQPKVAILGGWIGTLALMFNAYNLNIAVTSIDLDHRANRIAEKLNYDFNFTTESLDMYDVDYSKYDIIINTSSEHIPDIAAWRAKIPEGKIIAVQNNNFLAGDGHISCVDHTIELRDKLNLTEVLYKGTRTFPEYSRFMVIGRT